MPKNNVPNYRLHKASGQAFIELGGRRFYLGKYGSKASHEEYERRLAEYLANGRKLAPTLSPTGISCRELAVHFLDWAEGYYVKNGKSTPTFLHCRNAISMLTKHYGNESVDRFSPLSLLFLQNQWIEQGLARLTVNRYVTTIKQAFRHGSKFGWVDPTVFHALLSVDNLKKGRTKAPEYRDIRAVDEEAINRTLPFLPPDEKNGFDGRRFQGGSVNRIERMQSQTAILTTCARRVILVSIGGNHVCNPYQHSRG